MTSVLIEFVVVHLVTRLWLYIGQMISVLIEFIMGSYFTSLWIYRTNDECFYCNSSGSFISGIRVT